MLPIPFESKKSLYLKFKIYSLQKELEQAKDTLTNYQEKLDHFEREYNMLLHELIASVSQLRKQLNDEQASFDKASELPDDDLKYLKRIYLKACKLCHPDYLKPEALANQIFNRLNTAYQNQQVLLVESILFSLKTKEYQGHPIYLLKGETLLQKKQTFIQGEINQINDRISQIKMSYSFDIRDPEYWPTYIYSLQTDLEDELVFLREKESNPYKNNPLSLK